MAVAAAETNTYLTNLAHAESILVPEMAEDESARCRAARFIGACAVENTEIHIEAAETTRPIESLYDAIHKAKEGDKTAQNLVRTNVRTDVIERTIKSGHVMKVDLHVNEAGKIQQHGQSMESVQANSLRFAANNWQMRERTEAETTNSFRIEQLYHSGTLEEYSFVVFSCAADNMSHEAMEQAGFFTETMSCAIQVTAAEEDRLTTETAFVAGIKQSGAERTDIATVIAIAEKLGVNLHGKSATEILNTPLLVPNVLIQNGAIDMVRLWDECGGDTFFGEVREKQDYLQYRNQCEERERMLQPKVELIVQELINEAPFISDRVEATKRLHKISGKHMVQQAIFDTSIDLRVFGSVSAAQIMEARQYFEQGDHERGLNKMNAAIKNDQSSSCPGGASGESSRTDNKNAEGENSCTFVSKKCPHCKRENVLTTVTKTRITGKCGCSVRKKA